MSRHNSVNTMTWLNEVRTMGSSLIVAVCACQPSSPPASIWSEDFKYFPSQTIIISFQRLHQNRGTSWSPGSWCLFLIPAGFYSACVLCPGRETRLSVTTTRHKRNLKIVAGWRLLWCGGAVVINYRVSAVGVVAAGNVDKICNCSLETLPNDNEYNRANES